MYMKKLLKPKGIMLVQVILASAMMAGIAVLFMQLSKNMSTTQSIVFAKSDIIDLKREMRLILDDRRYCDATITDNGPAGAMANPILFYKSNVDNPMSGNGIDISFFLTDTTGTVKTNKKLNGADNPGANDVSRYGALTIKSMKLYFDNAPLAVNYLPNASHVEMANLQVITEDQISPTKAIQKIVTIPIKVELSTDTSGESTIKRCIQPSSGFAGDDSQPRFHWVDVTSPCPSDYPIDTEITDDTNGSNHNLNQDNGPVKIKLCAGGSITGSVFDYDDSDGDCPAGFLFADLIDNDNPKHHLSESSGTGGVSRWCLQGITGAAWHYTSCPTGWVWSTLWDDADANHNIKEGEDAKSTMAHCVTSN